MFEIFTSGATTENVYWACAVTGTAFFLVKAVMMGLGGFDLDFDMDGDVDVDAAGGDGFHIFSITSLSGFLMMFGWVGLACYKQYGMSQLASAGTAFVGGTCFMLTIAYMFHLAFKLTSEGEKFSVDHTIGKTASVYQKIPASGSGKIQITINGMLREIQAISETKEDIDSFTKVLVERVIDHETVSVKPLS